MPGPKRAAKAASPFARLNDLLAGIKPGQPSINLGLGEPQHKVPDFVGPTLAAHIGEFGRYPAIRGTDAFRRSTADWLDRRYALTNRIDPETMILPLNGSREGLFFAALGARERSSAIDEPAILLPNPFYQAYAAGVEAAGAEAILLDADAAGHYWPDLDALPEATLRRTIGIYVASPTAPQGTVASLTDWKALIETARRYDFLVFADECYSEIYRETPPAGALEAADAIGEGYGNVLAFQSLSKRSNLPGLRCGFVAGDPKFLTEWTRFRNMAAPQVPGPIQAVAVAAYGDEQHVAENRALYNAKYDAAMEILPAALGERRPEGGFFLWLKVGDGEQAALRLWREAGVRTIPGGYLCLPDATGNNPGTDYLRIAMVQDLDTTREALVRIARVLG